MNKNYNILSTSELKDELSKLTDEYNEARDNLAKYYEIMNNASNTYEEIKAIINKREGKPNE